MRDFSRLTLAALTVLLVAGCNSDSTPSMDSAINEACVLDAQSYCDKRRTCWPDGMNDFRFQRDWGTFDGCVEQRRLTCVADLQRKSTGLSPMRTAGCARAVAKQTCQDFLAGIGIPTSECPPVVGTLDDKAACAVGAQCKSNYCDRADDQVCGACADKGGIGASCDQNADCAGGLSCQTNLDTLAKTCQTPPPAMVRAKVGEPCGGMLPTCDSGLVCVGTGMMRACAAVVATEGAPCDPARRMLPDCDANLFLGCNRTTMLCEKRKLVDVGQPCNELPDGSNATCKGGANCVRLAVGGQRPVMGTCTADVSVGQPCAAAAADGPGCQPSLRCVLDAPGAAMGKCLRQDVTMCAKPATDGGARD
jgi:hypothetical protein